MDRYQTTGALRHLAGTAIALRGNDIDTDRIMPARFLKEITFAGLEKHIFADERHAWRERGDRHPFDETRHQGASILLVNRNFGCGSSREHAPQGLRRWGIRALVGESFGEIFAGNCLAVGMPCLNVTEDVARALQEAAERDRSRLFAIDLKQMVLSSGKMRVPVALPGGGRARLLAGTWDDTSVLLGAGEKIECVAALLPYLNNWAVSPDQPLKRLQVT